jgi:hypothetical protein
MSHNSETGMWFVSHDPKCRPWRTAHEPVSGDFDEWIRAVTVCESCPALSPILGTDWNRGIFLGEAARLAIKCRCDYCAGRKVPDDRPPAVSGGSLQLYGRARRIYMESGSITDKEAMLALVTVDVPDLEALGRDWEPFAASPCGRSQWRPGGRALTTALLWVTVAGVCIQGVTGRLPLAVSVVIFLCVLANMVIARRVRRASAAERPRGGRPRLG